MPINQEKFKILYELLVKEAPQKADAIIWLQGDRYDRALKTYQLYLKGYAKKIIISGNNLLIGAKKKIGENNISLDKMRTYLVNKGVKGGAILIENESMNTKNQAEHIINMAVDKKWSKLILVGSSYYQPRAFLTFLKQAEKLKWTGRIINQPALISLDKKPSGRDKSCKIMFEEEFKKIAKYKNDLVQISVGIKYFNAECFLRRINKNDQKLLFEWANDSDARANAINNKPIIWSEHCIWFNNILTDKSIFTFILTNLKKNIGMIRFNKTEEGLVISYLIDKKYRGQGYGKLIVMRGMNILNEIFKKPIYVAYVKKGNIASEKIFHSLNFSLKKYKIIANKKYSIFQNQQ